MHGQALPTRADPPRCGGSLRPVHGLRRHAWLGQRARLGTRGSTSHHRRMDRRLGNGPARPIRHRDRGSQPTGRRPGRTHDRRYTRLDALDLGQGRKSQSARARLGPDTGALGPRVCDRSSHGNPGMGARMSIHRPARLSDLVRQRPVSASRGETRCDTYGHRDPSGFGAEEGRLEASPCRLRRERALHARRETAATAWQRTYTPPGTFPNSMSVLPRGGVRSFSPNPPVGLLTLTLGQAA